MSMKVIYRIYLVADCQDPHGFLRALQVHNLSLSLSCLVPGYSEYGMHSSFSTGARREQ